MNWQVEAGATQFPIDPPTLEIEAGALKVSLVTLANGASAFAIVVIGRLWRRSEEEGEAPHKVLLHHFAFQSLEAEAPA